MLTLANNISFLKYMKVFRSPHLMLAWLHRLTAAHRVQIHTCCLLCHGQGQQHQEQLGAGNVMKAAGTCDTAR